jgi:glycosyltransferase involved in cell wall biosynthesis
LPSSQVGSPRVVFYAPVSDLRLLDLLEFYAEDLKSLESLGCHVVRTNSVPQAMRSEGDLLFVWWWHSSWPVIAAWRLRRRPVVATGASHLFEPPDAGRIRWLLRSGFTAIGIRMATLNIAVSQIETAKIARIRSSRLVCVPHAVDTVFFHPSAKAAIPTAIVVAQLNASSMKRKGVETAVRAVEIIRRSILDFRLLLVGPVAPDGQVVLDRLRDQVDFSGVEVVGEVTRDVKRRLLGEAWFCLQPSSYEGFGVSVLEAMACGAVPVCSRGGALPEVVGNAGVVLPVADTGSVVQAVLELVADPAHLRILAKEAEARALLFDRSRHTEGLARALRDVGLTVAGP